MPDLKKLGELLKGKLSGDKRQLFIVLLGIAGMVLILLSRFWGSGGETAQTGETSQGVQVIVTTEAYAQALEEKLGDLITHIEGVGRVRIMVTLENSGEYLYVQEEKRNLDKTVEPGEGEAAGKTVTKENVEQSYILVETDYGRKQALVRTQLEPKVQGVVIVCEGADNIYVQQSIINVVTTALNIPTTRVCVEKIS